jgi:hypothetical protein
MNIKDSITFQTLCHVSPWESKKIEKWLLSPAHNARPALLSLYQYLYSCTVRMETPDAAQAFTTVFGDAVFDEKKLRHALSWLMLQLRDCFCWMEMEQEPGLKEWLGARQMRRRNLEKGFQQQIREARAALGHTPDAGLYHYRLNFEQFQWEIQEKRHSDLPLEQMTRDLGGFFVQKLLQMGCMYRSSEALMKQDAQPLHQIHQILSAFPPDWMQASAANLLYHAGYQMLSEPENLHLADAFNTLLQTHGARFPKDESRDLLMMAINHCIRRINRGDRKFLERILGFYQLGLRQELLLEAQGTLNKFTYNNILLVMIALERWQEAATFLETNQRLLDATERDYVYRYNQAVLFFRQGRYDEAQLQLRSLSFTEPTYHLDARRMLLRIYFENDSWEALESLLDNLLTWVRRHPEVGYHREMYRNLAVFTGRLLKIPPRDKKKKLALAQKVRDTPLVADKNWLLEKIEGR